MSVSCFVLHTGSYFHWVINTCHHEDVGGSVMLGLEQIRGLGIFTRFF